MSLVVKCKDFTEGYYKLNKYLFFENSYDHERGGVTAHKFDIKMVSESPLCDLNLHDLNYTMNKWKMLNNLYLDHLELGVLIARLKHYKNQGKYTNYIPDIGMQFKSRKNVSGSCLMSLTLGYHQGGWHCSVFSRASELTCRWPIDLIFINVLLKTISKALNIDYSKIKVLWQMVSTYQSITSMPLFLVLAGEEDWFEGKKLEDPDLTSWQKATLKRYHKCFLGEAYSNFGVQRRPQEAYKILKGLAPEKKKIWTRDLKLYEIPFQGTLEEDYDEVDVLQEIDPVVLSKKATQEDLWGKGGYR